MTLTTFLKPALIIGAVLTASACYAGAAHGGSWAFDPALCPDLREDVRDRAVTRSGRDVREDRRDARHVLCPASAWIYRPGPRERVVRARVYAGPTTVVVRQGGYFTPNGARIVLVR